MKHPDLSVLRLLGLAALFLLVGEARALGAAPAQVEGGRLLPLEAVRAIATREGLVILSITAEAPRRLVVTCGGTMGRELFLKRASLVAYAAFQSYAAPVEVVFEHVHGVASQRCRVRRTDLDAYLARRLSKAEYHARLAYQEEGPAVRIPPPPVVVRPGAQPAAAATPTPEAPSPVAPEPPRMPEPSLAPPVVAPVFPTISPSPITLASPAANEDHGAAPAPAPQPVALGGMSRAGLAGGWRAGYALASGRAPLDAWVLEFNRPVLSSLDVRPGVWMIGAFTPASLRAMPGVTEGAAMSIDVLATSRRVQGTEALSFEGGLGARATVIQGPVGGVHPAAHLRVGVRWHRASLSLRYPLLAGSADPTASWDASLGMTWPYAGGAD